MSIQVTTDFSIENVTNPNTKQPFGGKYAGLFSIKRPSVGKKIEINAIETRMLKSKGYESAEDATKGERFLVHIMAFVQATATAELPEWFDIDKMYEDDDEDAVIAVWEEVGTFLATFRPDNNSGKS